MPTREQWVAYYLQGVPIPGWTPAGFQSAGPPAPGSAEQQSALIAFGISQMKQHQGG